MCAPQVETEENLHPPKLLLDQIVTYTLKNICVNFDRDTFLINPRRACAARVTVLGLSFCLSVRLSVTTFSAATRNKTANERY